MGEIVDGRYRVTVSMPRDWTLAEVQQVIDDQDIRLAKASQEASEAAATKAEYEALKAEMILAGLS
jgi:hypothetical protein